MICLGLKDSTVRFSEYELEDKMHIIKLDATATLVSKESEATVFYLGELLLNPVSQQRQAVLRTHRPECGKDNNGHEVHDVRQTGLFCLMGA